MGVVMGGLDGEQILRDALRVAPNVAYFLPKNVDPTQIELCAANEDNSWAALRAKGHTYADKAQERLGPVKGKAFQKEMTKAKRGTYRGGAMDIGAVNSIKFKYDDDE